MTDKTVRVLKALFVAYVAVTAAHLIWVIVAVDTEAKPASFGRFFSFWHQQYTSSNPRHRPADGVPRVQARRRRRGRDHRRVLRDRRRRLHPRHRALAVAAQRQGSGYEGLAEKYGVVQQIIVRGVTGNIDILQGLLFGCAPMLLIVLATSPDMDVYLVAIGDSPRLLGKSKARQFTYRPWRTAQYWVLACDRDACFVAMTMHHRI